MKPRHAIAARRGVFPVLAAFFVAALLAGVGRTEGRAAEESATLLATACTHGRLESCNCPSDPLGALDRVAAAVREYRAGGPVLLVDAGDYLPATRDSLRALTVLSVYRWMGYDAVALGDQELMYGPAMLDSLVESLPVVSANVTRADGTPVAPSVRFVTRGGRRFAFTSVVPSENLQFIQTGWLDHVRVSDADSALAEVLGSLPEDVTAVLLSHAGHDRDRSIAERFPRIDLIVGGHTQVRLMEEAGDGGDTPLLHTGGSARHMGVVSFRDGAVALEIIPMDEDFDPHPHVVDELLKLKAKRFRATQQ